MKNISLTKVSVVNAEFYAYHGAKEEEQTLGGKYQVDLDMYYDSKQATLNDDLKMTINYEEALFCVSEVIEGDSYSIVETIVSDILFKVMERFTELQKATVRVRKLNVPINRVISHIEVEQSVERERQ